jgi:uncharacterized protein (DUF2249 family)
MHDFEPKNVITLDVRPTIQAGNDPFNEIMATIKTLKDDQTLEIINIFEPIPLINKLKKMGYSSKTERPEDGTIHTFFKKDETAGTKEKLQEIKPSNKETFNGKLKFFGDKIKRIDVRHLEMPEPMVTILQEVETLDDDSALFVEHKKIPQYLLPELQDRNFVVLFNEIDANNIQLLIFRK